MTKSTMRSITTTTPTPQVGGLSRDALLEWLQKNPKTLGWDAVVFYNRGKANALLLQQYIKKLTAENYLTPISGEIKGPNGTTLYLNNIRLGIPRLSFENADIGQPKARITQAITAGLNILKSEPVGGYYSIQSISRPTAAAGPQLWMDVLLKDTPGEVSDVGTVALDISEMTYFDTNLFADAASKLNAQEFFKARFQADTALQTYTLGSLSSAADSTLTPQNFSVYTMAAPGAKSRAAPNYGDGAVVLFVTLKGGTNGSVPVGGSDFNYLIPNDDNGAKYSSALLLSNRVVFGSIIKPEVDAGITIAQYKVEYSADDAGQPAHAYLQATAGEITWDNFVFNSTFSGAESTLQAKQPIVLELKRGTFPGHTFRAVDNTLCVSWNYQSSTPFHQHVNVHGGANDRENDGNIEFIVNSSINMTPVVDPETFIIQFETDKRASSGSSIPQPAWTDYFEFENNYELASVLFEKLDAEFSDLVKKIKLPDIDTFLLRNLLFPDNNLMMLKDAHLPGDLAVFGNIDPSLTSFVISPLDALVNPGQTQIFVTDPPLKDVEWSIKGLPGDETPVGSINKTTGEYTAPWVEELQGADSQQTIVTATGTTVDGVVISSSAIISTVRSLVSVDPLFHVVGKGESKEFTAGSVGDGNFTWAIKDIGQNGSIVGQDGGTGLYTAAESATDMFVLDVVEVTDSDSRRGQADILVINGPLGGEIEVDLTEAANHNVSLYFVKQYSTGPVKVPSNLLTWTLLAGTGSIDENGVFRAPELEEPGFALITCYYDGTPDFPGAPVPRNYAFTVLPLPLGQYQNIARVYSSNTKTSSS